MQGSEQGAQDLLCWDLDVHSEEAVAGVPGREARRVEVDSGCFWKGELREFADGLMWVQENDFTSCFPEHEFQWARLLDR